MWEQEGWTCVETVVAAQGFLYAMTECGGMLATGGQDGSIKLWEQQGTWTCERIREPAETWLSCARASRSSRRASRAPLRSPPPPSCAAAWPSSPARRAAPQCTPRSPGPCPAPRLASPLCAAWRICASSCAATARAGRCSERPQANPKSNLIIIIQFSCTQLIKAEQ